MRISDWSSDVCSSDLLTYTHQVLDHQQVLRPIAKASFRLTAEGADVIADKAVAIATESRAGPVHIDVPIAVADQAVAPQRLRRRPPRSAERRVGEECVRTCRSRWEPAH